MSKLNHEHLLVKIKEARYQTPCGKYTIEYTNMSYFDDINWIAKGTHIVSLYAETLPDILEKIVTVHPYMDTELYKIIYGIDLTKK